MISTVSWIRNHLPKNEAGHVNTGLARSFAQQTERAIFSLAAALLPRDQFPEPDSFGIKGKDFEYLLVPTRLSSCKRSQFDRKIPKSHRSDDAATSIVSSTYEPFDTIGSYEQEATRLGVKQNEALSTQRLKSLSPSVGDSD
ncbi:hypothetical protein JOM56_013965 [Amanita muscaria]